MLGLLELPAAVDAGTRVSVAIDSLAAAGSGLPVVSDGTVVGWLTAPAVLTLLGSGSPAHRCGNPAGSRPG